MYKLRNLLLTEKSIERSGDTQSSEIVIAKEN